LREGVLRKDPSLGNVETMTREPRELGGLSTDRTRLVAAAAAGEQLERNKPGRNGVSRA
jgi:hypothetical protein